MTDSTPTISPLRQRMIDDMTLRMLAPRTQEACIRAVRSLTRFLGHAPDTATAEDLRRYQLHLVANGVSSITLNAAITGLRFFFEVTLDRRDALAKMSTVREPHRLPMVLSPAEVSSLLAAAPGLKYQAALSVFYGAGPRAGEVIALNVGDVDSTRMTLRVEQGKGHKDRYAMLAPSLLGLLRRWWRAAHARGKMLPDGWLFPGQDPVNPMSARQLNRACHAAAEAAGIDKLLPKDIAEGAAPSPASASRHCDFEFPARHNGREAP